MLEEMADTVGLVLLDNGDDPTNVTDEASIARSRDRGGVDSGQIRGSRATTTRRRCEGRLCGLRRVVG